MSCAHVVIPEKMRIATRVHVAVIPIPEEKDRNRSGRKLVGNTLLISRIHLLHAGTYTASPISFHWSLEKRGNTAFIESEYSTTSATLSSAQHTLSSRFTHIQAQISMRNSTVTHFCPVGPSAYPMISVKLRMRLSCSMRRKRIFSLPSACRRAKTK